MKPLPPTDARIVEIEPPALNAFDLGRWGLRPRSYGLPNGVEDPSDNKEARTKIRDASHP